MLAKRSEDKNIIDTVFTMVNKAKDAKIKYGEENVIDVTIGALYDENGNFTIFDSVNNVYKNLDKMDIAPYAESFVGNSDYLREIKSWVLGSHEEKFNVGGIATPGGSGSVSSTMKNILDAGQTLLIPNIGWGSYKIMAKEHDLEVVTYELFNKKDEFNVEDFREKALKIMKSQGKVLAIINDPCHNPTGYSMSISEWNSIVKIMNELSEIGNFILLNDLAYIDYSVNGYEKSREYMDNFKNLSPKNLVIFSFSCSKTLTKYGLRAGGSVFISNNKKNIDDYMRANEFTCRGVWSNIPKGGMKLFSTIQENKVLRDNLKKERDFYIELLKKRSKIFLDEAKEAGLAVYPYKEGFFITLKIENDKIKQSMEKLNAENIYPIQVASGIRIAICGSPSKKLKGLAGRIKTILK
ncbi:aminotransferase class I/II-fold pyridoxal phosphate-dependent enzyme [Psychrilyobacter piezotolerans]|uniref:Aminotransferase class I/II-fold pyridoxal phosphate-dependent enzyme n=1 Tax=Psychrilyobacter piezotolerans TaxID=2293438 RepID=A0ABX9KEH1_9FUSO|nr:aminotransferase class I/II-fold pyridoxal phosphate-dependent enzyme [Psychrilyobacter piezotolerans]RDE59615.1 aminotransferase class I/II-fold pyridoxal phosphate-dependent enzyme [Psychrilyobacter sp. S5]REI40029.1 aminotransferase class I/II-fold pyridoxal phosphate-dependent enzyme [Psychrilyobacter piezotolerans]